MIVEYTSGGLHLKRLRKDVFLMTRAPQTKASWSLTTSSKNNFIECEVVCNGIWQKQLLILKFEKGFFVDQTIFSCITKLYKTWLVRVKWKFEAAKFKSDKVDKK